MHIPPFDNDNKPIIDIENNIVPNIYFNIVKLSKNEEFSICLKWMWSTKKFCWTSYDQPMEDLWPEKIGRSKTQFKQN